jgi:hypothetical protein
VYRARDAKLAREVALKILPDAFANDPDRLLRFEREAKTLASLNHPRIAQIYGFEQSPPTADRPGLSALAMEFVDGEDLAARLSRGRMPADEAIELFYAEQNRLMSVTLQLGAASQASRPQRVVDGPYAWERPGNYDIMPDGRRFVFIKRIGNIGNAATLHVILNWPQLAQAR